MLGISWVDIVTVGLLVAAVETLTLAVYTAVDDNDRTLQTFTVLLLAVFVWTAGYGGRLLATTLGNKLIWQGILYIGVVVTPVAWLVFTLSYTGRERYVSRASVGALLVGPAATLVMLYSNGLHGLFYTTVRLTSLNQVPLLATAAGPLWWLQFSYSYAVVGLGVLCLVHFAVTSETLYRLQALGLVFAVVLPVAANVASGFNPVSIPQIDLTPLAFALSCLVLFVVVSYHRFLDLVPVANDAVVRTLEDGVLVVDDAGKILNANASAERMLARSASGGSLVGAKLAEVEPTLAVDSPVTPLTDNHGVTRGFEAARVVDGEVEWFWVRGVDLAATSKSGTVLSVTDITEKKRFERQLKKLQRTYRQLFTASDEAQIVDIAVSAVRDVLGLPVTGIWRHDEERSALVPFTQTVAGHTPPDGQPALEPGESPGWQAFETGELQVHSEPAHSSKTRDQETSLRSEILVPIGDWGLLASGLTTQTELNDVEFDLLRLVSSAVESAVVRARRERDLQRRERELQRQNERLEEFTSVVSHDLRSPLNQTAVLLELLADDYDDDRFASAESGLTRAKTLIDDLLTLAREGKTVRSPESGALEPTARTAWQSVPTAGATLRVDGELGTVAADHARLRQAFENLFRNAVDHGGESVTVRIGRLSAAAGIYVADDGPGIPGEMREDVLAHGYTTDDSGTGFGLAIVNRIVTAHGWDLVVGESRAGGARFELRGLSPRSDSLHRAGN